MMIGKIRQYLITNKIIDENCRINVDFLGEEPTEFAITPIPINPVLENYIDGSKLMQYQFQLISCNDYGSDVTQNIENSTFYENLYELITKNNTEGIFPDIKGIQTIECIDNGAILNEMTNTARYAIQMRITYYR